jgi:hypothetical protein
VSPGLAELLFPPPSEWSALSSAGSSSVRRLKLQVFIKKQERWLRVFSVWSCFLFLACVWIVARTHLGFTLYMSD